MAPKYYLKQIWLIVNWTPRSKFQWNLNENTIVIQANEFEIVVCKMKSFCLNVLIPFAIETFDNGKKRD